MDTTSEDSCMAAGRLINTGPGSITTTAEKGPNGFNLIALPGVRNVELNTIDAGDIPQLGPSAPRPANLHAVLRERRQRRASTHPVDGASHDQHKAMVQHSQPTSLENSASGQSNDDNSSSSSGARRGGVLNLRPNQTARAWAMEQIYTAPPPVALAPLRWNLMKVDRDFADSVADMKANAAMSEQMVEKRHAREAKELKRQLNNKLTAAKAAIPLNGQLRKLTTSVANLERLGYHARAEEARARLPKLEKKFWDAHLSGPGGYLEHARRRERAMKDRQVVEDAQVRGRARKQVAQVLLQRDGAKVRAYRSNEKSFEDPFCLHYACRVGDMERLKKLASLWQEEAKGDSLVVRALADARDLDSGRTALHFAAIGAQAEAADFLLELGADPNARDPVGLTPLHLGAGWGNTKVLGMLMLKGADKRAKDDNGRTPLDLARRNERHAELKFLSRWRDVGLPADELAARAALPPLPPLQAAAKEKGDTELYLALRSLDMKTQALKMQAVVQSNSSVNEGYRQQSAGDSETGGDAVGVNDSASGSNEDSQLEEVCPLGTASRLCLTQGRLAGLLRVRGYGDVALGLLRQMVNGLARDFEAEQRTSARNLSDRTGGVEEVRTQTKVEGGTEERRGDVVNQVKHSGEVALERALVLPKNDEYEAVNTTAAPTSPPLSLPSQLLPMLVLALNNLGEMSYALGQHAEAEAALTKALALALDTAPEGLLDQNGDDGGLGDVPKDKGLRHEEENDETEGDLRLLLTQLLDGSSSNAAIENSIDSSNGSDSTIQWASQEIGRGGGGGGGGDNEAYDNAESAAAAEVAAALVREEEKQQVLAREELESRRAQLLARAVAKRPLAAAPARNLGLCFFASGDLDRAVPLLRAHLASEETVHINRHPTGGHLLSPQELLDRGGVPSESLGLTPALELLALACARSAGTAPSGGRKGDRLRAEALAVFGRAKDLAQRELGPNHAFVARQEEHVGLAHFLAGSFGDAERSFKEAHDTLLGCVKSDAGASSDGYKSSDLVTERVDLSGEEAPYEFGVWHPDIMRICRNMAIAQCRRGPSRF